MFAKIKILLFSLLSLSAYAQTSFELQKLEEFAKVYGVVRYFHPSDEAAGINWNQFAAYGIEEILKTQNQNQFEAKLKNLFLPLAPSLSFNNTNSYTWNTENLYPVFWVHHGLGLNTIKARTNYISKRFNTENLTHTTKPYHITWDKYVKVSLSNNLSVTIPTVVYSNETFTLPVADKSILNTVQSSLKQQEFNRNTALANVIISWNILKHFYPYQDVVKVNWDHILTQTLEDAYNDSTVYDNYLTLSRFISNFNDGHMSIAHPSLLETRKYAPGIATRYRNNILIVKDVMLDLNGIQKGDIITKINDIPTSKYMDSLQQYTSGSKQYREWNSAISLLRGGLNSKLKLKIQSGKEIILIRDRQFTSNTDFYTRDDVSNAKEINTDTYYVNMDKLSKEEMEAQIPTIRKYKNLIIDLRGYPRTDQQHQLLNYLLPIVDSTKWLCSRDIYLPDFRYYTEEGNPHRLRKFISDHPLKTHNVLLLDERSISNAEMFSQVIKHYKLATIIGRPTAGANGNRNDIALLNEFQISFTGMKVINPDGSQFHAIGVLPDIIVDETPEDIKNGKDIYIEKALEILHKKK